MIPLHFIWDNSLKEDVLRRKSSTKTFLKVRWIEQIRWIEQMNHQQNASQIMNVVPDFNVRNIDVNLYKQDVILCQWVDSECGGGMYSGIHCVAQMMACVLFHEASMSERFLGNLHTSQKLMNKLLMTTALMFRRTRARFSGSEREGSNDWNPVHWNEKVRF